jgi:predicted dehydrogenase
MDNHSISRRKFIGAGALTFTGLSLMGMPGFANELLKNDVVRVGLIGAGQRGTGIANVLKNVKAIELVACCDVVEEHLKKGLSLAAPKAKGYTDYQKLLKSKDIDAVIIATPLYLHYQMVVDALDAGKHVYVEKTMTYDIPQALALVQKMKNSKLVLQVGHQYRYFGMYHKIKEIISKDWLGTVTHFECQYNRNSDWRRPVADPKLERTINWRMYKEYSGGVLAELCAHQIDIVNWMLDSHPLKVVGLGGVDYWKDGRETYDNVRTIYEYEKGIKSSVTSILSNEYNGYSMKILGSKGTIDIQREKAYFHSEKTNKVFGTVDGVTGATLDNLKKGQGMLIDYQNPDGGKLDATAYALMDFAACVRSGKKPGSNVETGRDVAIAVHMGNAAIEQEKIQLWKPEYSI